MSDAVSYRLLASLKARLQQILTGAESPWLTDIGADVRTDGSFAGFQGVADPQPVCSVYALEFDRAESGNSQKQLASDIGIVIDVFIPGETDEHMRLAHNARWDLVRALRDYSSDLPRDLAGSVNSLQLTGELIQPAFGSNLIAVQITAQAGLIERLSAQ
jgi:hypothetical protein